MAEVYTTTPGAVIQIGNYGEARNDTPAIVPDAVAVELSGDKRFRVDGLEKKAPKKGREA